MSFDYSTLITDRTRSDSDTLKALLGKPMAEWTAEERTAFNTAMLKGSYDYTDLNRVDACLEDLVARLGRVGCNVPGYERLKIERGKKPEAQLPDGYTELQYLESSGTQWIDTGVKPDQTYALRIKFQTEQSSSGGIAVSDANWQSNGFGIWCNAAAFGNGTMQTTEWHGTTPIEIELSQQGLFVNGNLTWTPDTATFTVPANMTLFSLNRNGSIAEKLTGKIYFAQLFKAGKPVRNFIPCTNPSGIPGLYDLVDGKFYGNSGTGVFLTGPSRATLPEGYTQLEYIQSTETQWIDTGFKPNQNTRIKMDCNVIGFNSGDAFLFGARIASGNTAFCLAADDANTRWFALYGNAVQNPTGTCTGKHSIDFNQNVLTLDGKNSTFAKTTFQSSYNLLLFATITNGNVDSQRGKMAVYSCQIYANGNLIRDFVPCVDFTGNAGLYDLVGGKFYGNAGTGSFTAGPVVTWDEPEEPTETLDPYTWYESDVPVLSQMARYRANVAAVRAALRLPEETPGVPETMRWLTTAEANSIEAILLALNFILNNIPTAVRHCGVTVCGSKGVRA